MPKKKREPDFHYRIAKLQISCQLFKSNERDNEKLKQVKIKEEDISRHEEIREEHHNVEINLEFDEIIVLFVEVSNLKPVI